MLEADKNTERKENLQFEKNVKNLKRLPTDHNKQKNRREFNGLVDTMKVLLQKYFNSPSTALKRDISDITKDDKPKIREHLGHQPHCGDSNYYGHRKESNYKNGDDKYYGGNSRGGYRDNNHYSRRNKEAVKHVRPVKRSPYP